MENNGINASLSTQNLTYRPGDQPVVFDVTVNNDSEQFASFQLEITAAGENRNSQYRWYKLEPEVAAAKPPGSSTIFQVIIFNTPIPGFVGFVPLTIKIFSPELGDERKLVLRLKIERDNKPTLLSVELPVREFQVYPRNSVDIPVRVRSLGQQTTNVLLRFAGVDSSWLVGGAERRLSLDPGGQTEVTFQCQPPSVVQSPSQNYTFTIEATSNNGYPANAQGNLEVLPVGFIEFIATEKHQKIPSKSSWFPDWKSDTANFELLLKNASNLYQEINIQLQGRDWRKCNYRMIPQTANLNLGETTKVSLEVNTKRPWVGIGKTLLLEAKSELSDQRLGSTDPATQTLELQILPIIPLWLQLAILALLAALLAFFLRPTEVMHTRSVNSVGFNGTGLSVVSGANDCTLRLWNSEANNLEPAKITYNGQAQACGRPQNPKGLLAIADDAVEVSRFMPVENNRVAVGLDNGVIEIRDVPSGNKINELQDSQDPKAKGDRVFDLAFTKNSLYLFSGYGSGKVRLWSRPATNTNFTPEPQEVIDLQDKLKLSGFQVRALTLSPDDTTLVMSGNFKRFLLWRNPTLSNKQIGLSVQTLEKLDERTGDKDFIWGLAFAPNASGKILATSDSAGYITIWDLNQCQTVKNASPQNEISEINCPPLDRWQAAKTSVRTLAFNEDGTVLVSGGDDGRIVVWYLNEFKLDKTKAAEGKTIYQTSKKINSIALRENKIVSGSEDFLVKLHHIK